MTPIDSPTPAITATSTNTAQTIPKFDSADIEIIVAQDGKVVKWKVSSHPLVLASPVWKVFVFPPWSPLPVNEQVEPGATSSGQSEASLRELDFEEDDPAALLLLLKIAHLQFPEVPHELSYNELFNVAILCDKYDCIKLVKPWVSRWCSIVEEVAIIANGKHNYLFVAWVFGRQATFNRLAQRLVLKVTTYEKSECLIASGERLSDLLPDGLIENIRKIRTETISKLLDLYLDLPVKYAGQVCKLQFPPCTAILCGSVMRPLIDLGVWPKDKGGHNYLGSIYMFSLPLHSIDIHTLPGHSACKEFQNQIRRDVWAVIKHLPDPLLPHHHEHFTAELCELCC